MNARVGDVRDDMLTFLERLFAVNPAARVILTVSPVPLIATYADRHVLVSNTYSKAALRAAAEEIVAKQKDAPADTTPTAWAPPARRPGPRPRQ